MNAPQLSDSDSNPTAPPVGISCVMEESFETAAVRAGLCAIIKTLEYFEGILFTAWMIFEWSPLYKFFTNKISFSYPRFAPAISDVFIVLYVVAEIIRSGEKISLIFFAVLITSLTPMVERGLE